MRECEEKSSPAYIFDIYRGTTHDGPGMRSTVFFKGCPLSCAWCHNPEGIAVIPEVWWDETVCIGCRLCHEACTHGAHVMDEKGIYADPAICLRCGDCVRACPTEAINFTARKYTVQELVDIVSKDKPYYDSFGGGVTVSGGEPLLQSNFVVSFFRELRKRGIHTAVDTCGYAPWEAFEDVLPFTDCLLYDIKLIDPDAHKYWTGRDNELILRNLDRIVTSIRNGNLLELWIRTPLIPGATAVMENIRAIGILLHTMEDVIRRWELCSFNNTCIRKYRKLRQEWSFTETPLLGKSTADMVRHAVLESGFSNEKLVISGIISTD